VGFSASNASAIKDKTPYIDSLAQGGVRLKDFYAHPTW
jgi:arylsulfatase A-like enzyme